jgi:hypothetical protein
VCPIGVPDPRGSHQRRGALGKARFDLATSATLHMEDTSPADIAGPTGTLAYPVKSMFQTDLIALKMSLLGADDRSAGTQTVVR